VILSVIIPAYNERATIDEVLRRVRAVPIEKEILVVDDASTDGTAERVEALSGPDLRLLRHPRNRGKGAAIRTGVLAATGRYVFFLDADLATPVEESLKLLGELKGGAPVVVGTRIQPDGSDMRASQPAQRRFVGRLFTIMRKAMRVLPDIDDTQCPMKGFRHDVAQAVFRQQQLSGWIFDAEVLYIARALGYRIVSVPVSWHHVEGSRLRVRPQEAFQVARDLVRLRFLHGRVREGART
jgi:glycosyltransferase involved in cell wall biosynthesis